MLLVYFDRKVFNDPHEFKPGLEDDIDVEEDGMDDHEEQEGDESAMQVDSRTDEHNIPKDPSSNLKKVTSFHSRS